MREKEAKYMCVFARYESRSRLDGALRRREVDRREENEESDRHR